MSCFSLFLHEQVNYFNYATAQLKGNFHTRPTHVPDVSGKKGHGSYVKSCFTFIGRFCTCTEAFHACFGYVSCTSRGRIPHEFWMCLTCVLAGLASGKK